MRKISGKVLSSKPVSLDRAANNVTRFASLYSGSSSTLSLYLQRTADAFTDLLRFHSNRSNYADTEYAPRRKKVRRSESDGLGKNPDEETVKGFKIGGKRDRKFVNDTNPNGDGDGDWVNANPNGDGVNDSNKKKKKKKKSGGDEGLDL